jgi:hypothetical protein
LTSGRKRKYKVSFVNQAHYLILGVSGRSVFFVETQAHGSLSIIRHPVPPITVVAEAAGLFLCTAYRVEGMHDRVAAPEKIETNMTCKLILGCGLYQLEPRLGQTGGGRIPLKFDNDKNLSLQGTQSAHLTHPRIH